MRVQRLVRTIVLSLSVYGAARGSAAFAADGAGPAQAIEYRLSAGRLSSCLNSPETFDFVKQTAHWKDLVPELVVSTGTSGKACADRLKSALEKKGFRVFIRRDPKQTGVAVEGRLIAAGASATAPIAAMPSGGAGEEPASASKPPSEPLTEAKFEPSSGVANAEPPAVVPALEGAPPPPSPEPSVVESAAPSTVVESARPTESVTPAETLPEPGFSKPIVETPPRPPDEASRWILGLSPAFLKVSGSGIPDASSGLNPFRFNFIHHYNTKYDVRAEWMSSIGSAQALPELMLASGEIDYTFVGERKSFKLKDPLPSHSLQAVGGFLYLSQNPTGGHAASSYRQGAVLLNELVAIFVGVRGIKRFTSTTSLIGQIDLIPVFPLMGNKMTVTQRFKGGAEYCSEGTCYLATLENAEYAVSYNDPALGDLQATHSAIGVGFTFEFF